MTNHPTAPSECEKPCICFDPENCTVVPPGFELRCKRLNKQPPSKTLPEYPRREDKRFTRNNLDDLIGSPEAYLEWQDSEAYERACKEWWERECRLRDERLRVEGLVEALKSGAAALRYAAGFLAQDGAESLKADYQASELARLASTITQLPPLPGREK